MKGKEKSKGDGDALKGDREVLNDNGKVANAMRRR